MTETEDETLGLCCCYREHKYDFSLFTFCFCLCQAGLPPQPLRDRVLYHIGHVLCGGTAGHQWSACGGQSSSSWRKPYGKFKCHMSPQFMCPTCIKRVKLFIVYHGLLTYLSMLFLQLHLLPSKCIIHFSFLICWLQSCPELIQHLRWEEITHYIVICHMVNNLNYDKGFLILTPVHIILSLTCIREKNFEEFSKHLKGLVNLYKLPGDK